MEAIASTAAKTIAPRVLIRPVGSGRSRVRAIKASERCSTKWLMVAAAPAAKAMPAVARIRMSHGTRPGVERNMPSAAVNTISETTLGLVSSKYSRTRILSRRCGVTAEMEGFCDFTTTSRPF